MSVTDPVLFHSGDLNVQVWHSPEMGRFRLAVDPPMDFDAAERAGFIEAGIWLPEVDWQHVAPDAVGEVSLPRPVAEAYLIERGSYAPAEAKTAVTLSICVQLGQKVVESLTDKERQ